MQEITGHQARVLVHVLENGPFKPNARIVDFLGAKPDDAVSIAISSMDVEDEDGLYGLLTLPGSLDRSIFITVTDGEPDRVAEIVAQVADYARTSALEFGNTLRLDGHRAMNEAGRVAVLLLRVDAIKPLSKLADGITIDSKAYATHLIVFLDEQEYRRKLNDGLPALLDHMEANRRDLVRFVSDKHLS